MLNTNHTMFGKELQQFDAQYHTPFQLNLFEDQPFFSNELLRVIPRRRLVFKGKWRGQKVVAKLFLNPNHAKRQLAQDAQGIKLLQDNKIPTPNILYQGLSEDKKVYILLLEEIEDSINLHEIWEKKENISQIKSVMEAVVLELATQHVFGIMQKDLHFKNFLITEKVIYTLDGAQILSHEELLSKKMSMDNLALFLSQLGVGYEDFQIDLFKYYAKSRGWRLKSQDMNELIFLIKKWNQIRWKQYSKKIFRDSTQFAYINTLRYQACYNKKYASTKFLSVIENPDQYFFASGVKFIKKGRSSTVIKVKIDDKDFVIKRYNLKDKWHTLRRAFRSTRAVMSWRIANKLDLFGIPTAKPVAFIENRCFGLRGKSYYISEYVPNQSATDFFNTHATHLTQPVIQMASKIIQLLKNLARLEMTHGDLKATNILITKSHTPILVDFDATIEHLSLASLNKAWQHEIKRLLENFSDNPGLEMIFRKALDIN